VKRRTVYYLIPSVLLLGLLVFLLGSFHWLGRKYYLYATSVAFPLVFAVDEMILSIQRPDLKMFRRRQICRRGGKGAAFFVAAWAGLCVSYLFWIADITWTVSGLAFLTLVTVYGLAAAVLARGIFWHSRQSGGALLVVAALMAVLAAAVPLFRLEGDWSLVRGWYPAYFLLGTAILVAGAGALALHVAKRLGGFPDFWVVEAGAR
jgi:hypothetical protein